MYPGKRRRQRSHDEAVWSQRSCASLDEPPGLLAGFRFSPSGSRVCSRAHIWSNHQRTMRMHKCGELHRPYHDSNSAGFRRQGHTRARRPGSHRERSLAGFMDESSKCITPSARRALGKSSHVVCRYFTNRRCRDTWRGGMRNICVVLLLVENGSHR
jgi:hypothetical protein